MSRKLISLPSFSFSSLDFDSIVDDVKALVYDHPEYNENWDDFLSSNAGMMMTELFAYVTEKYCSRIDWISKQLMVSTATDRQAVINLLKLINHRLKLPTSSRVNATMKLTKWISPFYLGSETIFAPNLVGDTSVFTILDNSQDGRPNYNYSHYFNTGTETDPILEFYNIPLYQGKTVIENDIYMEGLDGEYIDLQTSPVVEGSIRIFSITRNYQELPLVDSYISPEAQQNDIKESEKLPPYMIEISKDNSVRIKFGITSLVKIASKGERIQINYRVGGGPEHNIVTNAITMTKVIQDNSGRKATMIFGNITPGYGGAREENLEQAKLIAPLTLRSANKTVTREDYLSHLEADNLVMKAQIIGKENEPLELRDELGYSLPPLDTWIYITPQRQNWETYKTLEYNSLMKIGRPYSEHGHHDYEDISITSLNQTTYLKKYKKFYNCPLYITLHEETPENVNGLWRDSYIKDIDYTINTVQGSITRIQTADGGNIPAGNRTLRVRYVKDITTDIHKLNTNLTFSNGVILLNRVYPTNEFKMTDIFGKIVYEKDVDYTIDFGYDPVTKKPSLKTSIRLTSNSKLLLNSKVVLYYSDKWAYGDENNSEEKLILDIIKNKKMICVDNHIKDSIFTSFDIAATVYCSKNLIKTVPSTLESNFILNYSLSSSQYNKPVSKSEIMKIIMTTPGVSSVEISYFGKNYEAYRKYLLDIITEEDLINYDAISYEHKLPCKYNEVLVLSSPEYDGTSSIENKRRGLIFTYKENTEY